MFKVCLTYSDTVAKMQRHWLLAESTMSDQTAFTHRLDKTFWAYQSAILLSAFFFAKYLMPKNYLVTWCPLSN